MENRCANASFDWFFKSRTPDELKRRGQTLLLCIMKDKAPADDAEFKPAKGSKVGLADDMRGRGRNRH